LDTNPGTIDQPYQSISQGLGSVDENGTVYIADGVYTGGNNTNITISKSITLTGQSQSGTMINGSDSNWIFNVTSGANVVIQNLTLTNGKAPDRDSTLNYGGAIYNMGNLTVLNCIFTNNTARVGGAIYSRGAVDVTGYNRSYLTVLNSTFNNNTAQLGGAIYSHYGNTLTVTNSKFMNNTATKHGGAIFNLNGAEGSGINRVDNCEFTGNTATNRSGAIYNNNGIFTVNNCTFTNNTATTYGGAIYHSMGNFTVTDSTFTNNTATDGGCISNWSNLTVNNSTFTNNTAYVDGGAISNKRNHEDTNTINITNSKFTGNTAANCGGAIYINATGTITNCNFLNNTAKTYNLGGGGAIYNNCSSLTVTGCTFQNNRASYWGGAIYNNLEGICNITDSIFTSNTVSVSDVSISDYGMGGAIYSEGNLTVTSSTFNNNNAWRAGAICNGGNFTVKACNFIGNTATNTGGAIVTESSNSTVNGCNFTNNRATEWGGAIWSLYNLNVTDSNFNNNTANRGGAIFDSSTLTIANSSFTNNTATDRGGAISNYNTLTITNSTFTNNTAANYGGAIYNNNRKLTVIDCTFINNVVQTGKLRFGGAIYNNGTLNVTSSSFTANSASNRAPTTTIRYGGAIYNNGTLTVDHCDFTSNTARGGGAIYNNVGHTLNVSDSTFKLNTAYCGGGIYNNGGNVTVDGSIFENNTGWYGGGAIVNGYSGTLNVTSSSFTVNSAPGAFGGAICNYSGCTMTAQKCNFTSNTAYGGGAIYNEGSSQVHFSRFVGNTASEGNAVYCYSSPMNATENWWGSNLNPKTIDNLITEEDGGSVYTDPWVILTVTASPTSINNTGTSTVTADLNHYMTSTGYVGTLSDHIPDGTITLDIPWGSFKNLAITHSISLYTVNSTATTKFYAIEGSVNSLYNPVKITGTAYGYTTNTTESAYITIKKAANLYIHITSNRTNPKIGEPFTLTYKLGNSGPDPAENVKITIPLPEGFELSGISGDGNWTYKETTRTITWTFKNLKVGDPYLYITGKLGAAGNYLFSSSIAADTYNINTEGVTPITINVEKQVNAASNTIAMQETGTPINYLILAVLMVLSGLLAPKRK
jgi:uncharacterized repeat protein (TIGR01451 family)